MKKCPYCGSEIQEGAEFCLYCMRTLNQKEDVTPKAEPPKYKLIIIAAVAVLAAVLIGIICFSLRGGDDVSEGEDTSDKPPQESTDVSTDEKTGGETTDEDTAEAEDSTRAEEMSSAEGTTAESRPAAETEVQTEVPSVSIPKGYDDPVWEVITVDGGVAVTGLSAGEDRKFTVPETIDGKTVVAIEFDGDHHKNSWEGVIELTLPDTVKYIGNYVFQNCELQKITLPDGLEYIGEHAFTGASLVEIVIPDSVTFIDKAAFYACKQLASVTLPSSIQSIEYSTFFMCYELKEIYIPASVTYIDALAFTYCYTLSDVYILGSDVTAHEEAFEPDYRKTDLIIHAKDDFVKKHSEYYDDWDAEFVITE